MHAVVRQYTGASELFDLLQENKEAVERLLRDVRGFVAYYLVRSGNNGFSVTICEDRIGTEESSRLAAAWITENAPNAPGNVPAIAEGEVVIHAAAPAAGG